VKKWYEINPVKIKTLGEEEGMYKEDMIGEERG